MYVRYILSIFSVHPSAGGNLLYTNQCLELKYVPITFVCSTGTVEHPPIMYARYILSMFLKLKDVNKKKKSFLEQVPLL